MVKRFTDTDKWKKNWFIELSNEGKLLWLYICDTCDYSGICDFNSRIFSAHLGFKVTTDKINEIMGKKIIWIEDNKFHIPSFIDFQYNGQLNPDNKVHASIITKLDKIKSQSPQGAYQAPPQGAKEKEKEIYKDQDKELEKDKEKEKEVKSKYGEYQHVLLTAEEFSKLTEKLGSIENVQKMIKELDEGIELKGYKYKSHYLAILKWNKNAFNKSGKGKLPSDDPEGTMAAIKSMNFGGRHDA